MTPYRAGVLLGCAIIASGCMASQRRPAHARDLVFLTREGCVNTTTMRANFDAALQRLGWPADYEFIDADTLAESDPRGGYGTPTVLVGNRDLFGLDEPATPHPPPS
ncbi:MAG: hypothetical protein R2745_01625 [Vicinamibacterales bacterium]